MPIGSETNIGLTNLKNVCPSVTIVTSAVRMGIGSYCHILSDTLLGTALSAAGTLAENSVSGPHC